MLRCHKLRLLLHLSSVHLLKCVERQENVIADHHIVNHRPFQKADICLCLCLYQSLPSRCMITQKRFQLIKKSPSITFPR